MRKPALAIIHPASVFPGAVELTAVDSGCSKWGFKLESYGEKFKVDSGSLGLPHIGASKRRALSCLILTVNLIEFGITQETSGYVFEDVSGEI